MAPISMIPQRRLWIGGLLLVALLTLRPETGLKGETVEEVRARPNIVLIMADDMGIGDVGAYNQGSQIPTPRIDGLAEDGMRMTDAHSSGSVCVPTRYGLLTGRYPFRSDLAWRRESVIREDRMTLGSLLQDAGYRTGCVGKWHLGFDGGIDFDYEERLRGGPTDRGFDFFFGLHASLDIPPYFYIRNDRCVQPPSETIEENRSDEFSPIQGAFWRGGPIAPDFQMEEVLPRLTREAIGFLERQAGDPTRPFFLYFPLPAPHTPWVPNEPFWGKSDAGPYGDFVVEVDHSVGRILTSLSRLGVEEETLVIFTSDNGPVWYEDDVERFGHRSTDGYRGMKGDIWEGGHRMPFIVRWPGEIKSGTVSDVTFGFTDLLSTFADLLGTELPEGEGIDSTSLLAAWRGEDGGSRPREATIHRSSRGFLAVRQGDWKLIPRRGSGGFSNPSVIDPEPGEPQGQLYNLAADPGETENRYAEHPERVKRLMDVLEKVKARGE